MTATEFKRTEADMLDYLDNAAIGLHWVDGEGTILWANPADYEPLGYSADEYIGHSITEFHAEEDVINDILPRLLGGETLYNSVLEQDDGASPHTARARDPPTQLSHPATSRWSQRPCEGGTVGDHVEPLLAGLDLQKTCQGTLR